MSPAAQVPPADAMIAGFLHSIVLAVVDFYDKISPFLSDTAKPTATTFQNHHREHVTALAAEAGSSAAKVPNQALTLVLTARLQNVTEERGALNVAFGLEHQLAETYAYTLTMLTTPEIVQLVATIITVVSTHAGILGSSAGLTTAALFPNGALIGSTVGDGSNPQLGFYPASFPAG
jgi:hypothetical protein